MASTITLSAYEIRVRRNRNDEFENLSDFDNGHKLLDFFQDYLMTWMPPIENVNNSEDNDFITPNLNVEEEVIEEVIAIEEEEEEEEDNEEDNEENNSGLENDDVKKKVVRLQRDSFFIRGNTIGGILESGDYGYVSSIIETDSGREVYKKGITEAEMLPFYFTMNIEDNNTSGILILQRFKQFGVYSLLKDFLKHHFNQTFSDFVLDLKPLVSNEIIENFLTHGNVNKLTFKRMRLTRGIVEQFDPGINVNEEIGRIEYSIVANKGRSLPILSKLLDIIQGREPNFGGFADDIDYSSVAVSVRLNGHTRTLDLSSLQNIGAFFDVTRDVTMDEETGHPVFNSIKARALEILEDLRVTLNMIDEQEA